MAPTTVPAGIYAPVIFIPTNISLYSASNSTVLTFITRVPTACNIKSPSESCNGLDDGFEVLFVGYNGCFIPAESTQLILV